MFCFQLDVADNGMGLLTGQKLAALEFPRGFTVRWCPVLSNCSRTSHDFTCENSTAAFQMEIDGNAFTTDDVSALRLKLNHVSYNVQGTLGPQTH